MKYAWIDTYRDRYSVSRLCRILDVSRSGYCQWRRGSSRRAQANAALDGAVVAIHRSSCGSYAAVLVSCGSCMTRASRRAPNAYVAACNARGCARSTSVRIGSRRIRRIACRLRRICLIVVSTAGCPIRRGSATSRSSGPVKAGYIWRRSWIWRADASWADRCPNESTPTWSARHCAARVGNASRHRVLLHSDVEAKLDLPETGRRLQDKYLDEPTSEYVG